MPRCVESLCTQLTALRTARDCVRALKWDLGKYHRVFLYYSIFLERDDEKIAGLPDDYLDQLIAKVLLSHGPVVKRQAARVASPKRSAPVSVLSCDCEAITK